MQISHSTFLNEHILPFHEKNPWEQTCQSFLEPFKLLFVLLNIGKKANQSVLVKGCGKK